MGKEKRARGERCTERSWCKCLGPYTLRLHLVVFTRGVYEGETSKDHF